MEQTDDLLTKRENDDAKNVKVIQHEGDQDGLSEMPALKVPSGLVDLRSPEKPRPSKQGAKKLERVLSVETSSNRQNLVGSKKNIGSPKNSELQKPINYQKNDESMTRAEHSMISKVMDTLGPLDDHTNTFGKAGVSSAIAVRKIHQREKAKGTSKTLEKNSTGTRKSSRLSMRETVNASAQKKGFASSGAIFEDGSSSSSDDEHRSSNVTLPPDDLSSSDYSEGESQGVVISQHGNAFSCALKILCFIFHLEVGFFCRLCSACTSADLLKICYCAHAPYPAVQPLKFSTTIFVCRFFQVNFIF